MPLITRTVAPNNKNAKLTSIEMDNNLYYLQSLGVSALTFSSNTLTLTNPTGGTISVSGFSGGLPYTTYKALVTLSSGTFTVTQLENTIGNGTNTSPNDIQWSTPSNGVIRATKTGAFTSSNILISVENMFANGVPYVCIGTKAGPSNNYYIDVYIYPSTFILSSTPNFTNLPVEIRIY